MTQTTDPASPVALAANSYPVNVGDRVKITIAGLAPSRGTVEQVEAEGHDLVVLGPRGGCTVVCRSLSGTPRAIKGFGSMNPKGGAVLGIEIL